jgi:CRP/FNR family cyclic AMP-dependent transcriptional regulator
MSVKKNHRELLCENGWLASCTPDFQDALLKNGKLKTLEAGATLYREGKRPGFVHGLIEGQVDVQLQAPNGEELIYPFSAPGRWYGLADVVANFPAFGTAKTGKESVVFCISKLELLDFLGEDPTRYQNIVAHEYALRRGLQETVIDLVTSDSLELVARRLVWMAEFEGTDLSSGLSISQFDFAASLGISPPTVQRAFRELKKLGAIETSYGEIKVQDLPKLKNFVNSFVN